MGSALEQNKTHFNAAREKLEQWADDMVLSAEKVLLDTKEQIKAMRRRARAGDCTCRAARDSGEDLEA